MCVGFPCPLYIKEMHRARSPTHTHTLQDLYNSFAVKASAFLTFKHGLTPGWIVDIYILYLYFWFSSLEQTEFQ